MPRPTPLSNAPSSYPRYDTQLTPQEAYSAVELEEIDFDNDDDYGSVTQQQNAPLLSSSASNSFPEIGYRKRPPRKEKGIGLTAEKIISRLPLALYSSVAAVLLVLTLKKYATSAGPAATPAAGAHATEGITLISYENYTSFPLDPIDGIMAPHRYWSERHPRDPGYAPPSGQAPICKRTITYQLDGWAGLMAAALAREYGNVIFSLGWSDHFLDVQLGQPGPEPGCRPPPPEEYVACPRTARHWISFGHGFNDEFQDPFAHSLNRMKPLFNFAWLSFETVIQLIQWAREELSEKLDAHYRNPRSTKGVQEDDGPAMGYLGVHIRRGDRSPDWRSAVESWTRLGLEVSAEDNLVQPFPDAAKEFADSFSPDRVFSLSGSKREELRLLASPEEYFQDIFMTLPDSVRVQATRGMIVDFALLSGAWANDGDLIPMDGLCSEASRLGLGWKRAFGVVSRMGEIEKDARRWMDVDLRGRVVPVWEPLQAY
ncbi:hypothetical protein B0H12DRAFT_1200563 [Mycena haematopus]|nr:hypothetical protein B0H12DRAFT_1200563 [Mycena haematopus]